MNILSGGNEIERKITYGLTGTEMIRFGSQTNRDCFDTGINFAWRWLLDRSNDISSSQQRQWHLHCYHSIWIVSFGSFPRDVRANRYCYYRSSLNNACSPVSRWKRETTVDERWKSSSDVSNVASGLPNENDSKYLPFLLLRVLRPLQSYVMMSSSNRCLAVVLSPCVAWFSVRVRMMVVTMMMNYCSSHSDWSGTISMMELNLDVVRWEDSSGDDEPAHAIALLGLCMSMCVCVCVCVCVCWVVL